MKQPPVVPNVNGLLFFLKDASTHFSAEEQSEIALSSAGQRLKQSYDQCSGHSKQLRTARILFNHKIQQRTPIAEATNETWNDEINTLKRQVQVHEIKYINCLTYMACPTEWKCYSRCWGESTNVVDMKEHTSNGTLEWICRSERLAIERCIGNAVANAVMAGDFQHE